MPAPAPEDRLRFLAPAWLEALDEEAARLSLPADVRLTLQQVVTGTDGPGDRGVPEKTEVRYHLVAGDGRLSVRPGQALDPDLTLTQPYHVAVAISRGALNAQQALSTGRLKISGNVELLVRHGRVLTGLTDIYAPLRDRTDY